MPSKASPAMMRFGWRVPVANLGPILCVLVYEHLSGAPSVRKSAHITCDEIHAAAESAQL